MKKELGKIHIYTGNGKGKTTAAIGLALRAAGAGFKVCIIQFMKPKLSGEIKKLEEISNVKVYRFGGKKFILKGKNGGKVDKKEAEKALKLAENIITSKKYDLVVLDEINIAIFFKLLTVKQVVNLIKNKSEGVELVITGRKVDPKIIKLANYVTKMKEIKHPYNNGLLARRGIEY